MSVSALSALPLPRASAWDPTVDGEGKLDPLGLGAIGDRLAATYAPHVRARMQRIRFTTASCVGASIAFDLADAPVAVLGDTAELAFERVVIECMAREGSSEIRGVPGIAKARTAMRLKQRLDPGSYLKGPRVFGFHGVYRPLVQGFGALDNHMEPLAPAQEIVALWKAESAATSSDPLGDGLYSWLRNETARALSAGSNQFGVTSDRVARVARAFDPSTAGTREKKLLSRWLRDPVLHQVLPEILGLLDQIDEAEPLTEKQFLAAMARTGSPDVRVRMLAVAAFETFAQDLELAFDRFRYLAASELGGTPSSARISEDDVLRGAADRLPKAYLGCAVQLDELQQQGVDGIASQFSHRFVRFSEPLAPVPLVDQVMTHHGDIQGAKPPNGKRPWVDSTANGWVVRPSWCADAQPEQPEGYTRPYRIAPLLAFLGDLDG